MIEWDGDVEYDDPAPTCDCEGWEQRDADGPWCGYCGHHINHHNGTGPEVCDPGQDD